MIYKQILSSLNKKYPLSILKSRIVGWKWGSQNWTAKAPPPPGRVNYFSRILLLRKITCILDVTLTSKALKTFWNICHGLFGRVHFCHRHHQPKEQFILVTDKAAVFKAHLTSKVKDQDRATSSVCLHLEQKAYCDSNMFVESFVFKTFVWTEIGIKTSPIFIKSFPKVATVILIIKLHFFKIVAKYLGYFYKRICQKDLSNSLILVKQFFR